MENLMHYKVLGSIWLNCAIMSILFNKVWEYCQV